MSYEKLIETVSFIVESEKIHKLGLSLVYTLKDDDHLKMNQALYSKANPYLNDFTPSDEFEVNLGGIVVKFLKVQK